MQNSLHVLAFGQTNRDVSLIFKKCKRNKNSFLGSSNIMNIWRNKNPFISDESKTQLKFLKSCSCLLWLHSRSVFLLNLWSQIKFWTLLFWSKKLNFLSPNILFVIIYYILQNYNLNRFFYFPKAASLTFILIVVDWITICIWNFFNSLSYARLCSFCK